jgi:hypothetical protein
MLVTLKLELSVGQEKFSFETSAHPAFRLDRSLVRDNSPLKNIFICVSNIDQNGGGISAHAAASPPRQRHLSVTESSVRLSPRKSRSACATLYS